MIFSLPLSGTPRTTTVQQVSKIEIDALKKQLMAQKNTEAGFAHCQAPIHAINPTAFVVAGDGEQLMIATQIYERKTTSLPHYPVKPDAYKGLIEIIFDLRCDSMGFCRYGFQLNYPLWENEFSPYPEAASSQWKIPSVLAWHFELQEEPNTHGYWTHYLFVTFSQKEIFAFGDTVGFNVGRADTQAALEEASAWSFVAGNGCRDAQSLGRLSLIHATSHEEWPKQSRSENFLVSMVNDAPDMIIANPYTPEALENEMCAMKQWGIRRMDWIHLPDHTAFWAATPLGKSFQKTDEACGDLITAAAEAAHRHGIEFFATLKLFDLSKARMLCAPDMEGALEYWDGSTIACTADVSPHQEAFMQSNPAWRKEVNFPIKCVRLFSETVIPELSNSDLRIFVSTDNKTYSPLDADSYTVSVRKCARTHKHLQVDGMQEQEGTFENWVLEIDGLHCENTFLHIEAPNVILHNRWFLLAEAEDHTGKSAPIEISCTLAKNGSARFLYRGDWCGWGNHIEGILQRTSCNLNAFGLAFIDPPMLPGLLEPTHPKSREIWLNRIQQMLDAGVDGVALRSLCHHNEIRFWKKYLFSPTVRQAFEAKFNRPPTASQQDLIEIYRIRGNAMTELLRAARKKCDSKNAKLIFQVEPGSELPVEIGNRMGMYFDYATWMKEGLVDELHLRFMTVHFPWLRNYLLPLAKKYDVKIHILSTNLHCGVDHQAVALYSRMIEDAVEAGVDGFVFYESAGFYEINEENAVVPKGLGQAAILAATQTAQRLKGS